MNPVDIYRRTILRHCAATQKLLLPVGSYLFTLTFWSDKGANYAWAIDEQFSAVLSVVNLDGCLGQDQPIAHFSSGPMNINELSLPFFDLLENLRPSLPQIPLNRLGASRWYLARFPNGHRMVADDLHEEGSLTSDETKLMTFIQAIEKECFPGLPTLLRTANSPLSQLTPAELSEVFVKEQPSVVAFLMAKVPSKNLLAYIDTLSPKKRERIITIASTIDANNNDLDWLLREVERQVERSVAKRLGSVNPSLPDSGAGRGG